MKIINNNTNEAIYLYFLIKYISQFCNLKELDDLLANKKNSLVQNKEELMDKYQLLCSEQFNYVYIRNSINLSNLDENETKWLNGLSSNINNYQDSDIFEFIKRTLKKVLTNNISLSGSELIAYGPNTPNFYAPNLSVIIGINYDKYNNFYNNYTREEILSRNDTVLTICNLFTLKYGKKVQEYLGIPLKIIEYDEHSVDHVIISNNRDNHN